MQDILEKTYKSRQFGEESPLKKGLITWVGAYGQSLNYVYAMMDY